MAAQTCVALQLTQAVPRGGSGAVFCYHSCFPNQAQEQPYGPGPAGTHRLTVEGPGHLGVSLQLQPHQTRPAFQPQTSGDSCPPPQSVVAGPGLIWLLRTRISENFDSEVGIPSSDFVPSSPLEQRGTQVWPVCSLHDQCVQDGVPGPGV